MSTRPSTKLPSHFDAIPQRKFPTGNVKASYKDYENWSEKKWQWEFLCRNTQFREQCDALEKKPSNKITAQRRTASKFGLKKFKSYREQFVDSEIHFVTSSARVVFNMAETSVDIKKNVRLRPLEALAVINLTAVLKDEKNLERQLEEIRQTVVKTLGRSHRLSKKKPKFIYSEERLQLLRILDMHISGKKMRSDIYAKSMAEFTEAKSSISPKTEKYVLDATFRKAFHMSNEGYLHLVQPPKEQSRKKVQKNNAVKKGSVSLL